MEQTSSPTKRYRGRHGPIKYFSEEERKRARTLSKSKYMLNKSWCCPVCGNRDYSLAGKHNHLKSKKHQRNVQEG